MKRDDLQPKFALPYLWLVAASFIAGVMNAMAGGGSFISFPAMLAIGVPADPGECDQHGGVVAGAVDLGVGAARGSAARLVAGGGVGSVLGGVGGAVVLLHTRQMTFMHLVPWLLLVASLLFWVSGPVSRWLRERSAEPHVERHPAMLPLFCTLLPVCFYIGYFGAGAGFLIMSALALFGVEEMNELNALKVTAACLSNLCAVVTFISAGRLCGTTA